MKKIIRTIIVFLFVILFFILLKIEEVYGNMTMNNKDDFPNVNVSPKVEREVEKEAVKDIASKIAGFLSALLPVLAILGINFDWFTMEFINNIYFLILAIGGLVINVITIWRNHFVTKKAKEQNAVLKQTGMKE